MALSTPAPLIEAAFDGLIDRLKKTDPYAKPERVSASDPAAVRDLFRRVARK